MPCLICPYNIFGDPDGTGEVGKAILLPWTGFPGAVRDSGPLGAPGYFLPEGGSTHPVPWGCLPGAQQNPQAAGARIRVLEHRPSEQTQACSCRLSVHSRCYYALEADCLEKKKEHWRSLRIRRTTALLQSLRKLTGLRKAEA
ncbi:hypothetical protein H1C71_027710 [Ictidomys tridecemlineatus]|nr:hypothetical protein H1C71_027710 [Ictidomys tridecemlineatus]